MPNTNSESLQRKSLNLAPYYRPPKIFLCRGVFLANWYEVGFYIVRAPRVVLLTGIEPEPHLMAIMPQLPFSSISSWG